jgi:hypothetical protein
MFFEGLMKQCLCFSGRTIPQKGERIRSFDYARSAREKLNPIFIDLTKPERDRSVSKNRVEVCRDREAEPCTAGKFLVVCFGLVVQFTFHVCF